MIHKINSIMVIGDSLSKGAVYNEDKKRYIFLKESFIKTITDFLQIPVHNLSKFGSTLMYGKNILQDKLSEINPDVVLIEYGGNDCDFKWDEIAENPFANHKPRTSPDLFEQTLRSIVELLVKAGKIPIFLNLPPLNAVAYFNWFTQNNPQKGHEILKWLRHSNRIYWWQEQYSCSIEKIARNTETLVINIRTAFLKTDNYKNYICLDGIHPNEKGQKLISDVMLEFISLKASYLFSAI